MGKRKDEPRNAKAIAGAEQSNPKRGDLGGAQTGIAQQGGLGAPPENPKAIAQGRGPVSVPVPADPNDIAGANQPAQEPVGPDNPPDRLDTKQRMVRQPDAPSAA